MSDTNENVSNNSWLSMNDASNHGSVSHWTDSDLDSNRQHTISLSSSSVSEGENDMVEIDDDTSNSVEERVTDILGNSLLYSISSIEDTDSSDSGENTDYLMDDFVAQKMQDRPPRYDNIENDRVVSTTPIAVYSYDVVPIDNSHNEPPPLYDDIHYAHPDTHLQGTPNPPLSFSNEVVQPSSTAIQDPTITTEEMAIDPADD